MSARAKPSWRNVRRVLPYVFADFIWFLGFFFVGHFAGLPDKSAAIFAVAAWILSLSWELRADLAELKGGPDDA